MPALDFSSCIIASFSLDTFEPGSPMIAKTYTYILTELSLAEKGKEINLAILGIGKTGLRWMF